MDFLNDKKTYLASDSNRGGGEDGDDHNPWDRDRELAKIFKRALLAHISAPKDKENAQILQSMATLLQERLSSVGNNVRLTAPQLRILAEAVNKLPSPADRIDPGKLAMRFRNMDLTL